jgi:hypothetical protein
MRMKWTAAALGVLVWIASYSIAQQAQGTACAGKVVTAKGQPVANAKVVLYHNWSRWGLGCRVTQETQSATDGSFAFKDALTYSDPSAYPYGNDSYVILAVHPDHAAGWCNIAKGKEKSGYDIVLTESKPQTITVTDHDGKPLPGVRVWPYDIGDPSGAEPLFRESLSLSTDTGILGATTDANGMATIANLPQTKCSFHATLNGYAPGLAFPGKKTIRLSKGATVSGSVVDEEGKPVQGAIVKFFTNWRMWQFFLAQTDADGRFRLEDLPAEGWDMSPWGKNAEAATGAYVITIEHGDYIAPEMKDQFRPGDVRENLTITASHGTLVKCQVMERGSDRPVAGARIQGSGQGGRIDGRSDANGVFAFRVMSGQISLFFTSPPEGVYMLSDQESRSSLQVDAQGKEMTVTLKTPAIAGRLTTVRGRVQLPGGTPAANVKISTSNSARYNTSTWTGSGGAYTGTNADGSFELKEVPAGLKLFIYGNTKDFQFILAETIDSVQDPTVLSAPLIMKKGRTASALLRNKQGELCANMSVNVTPMIWGDHIPRANEHRVKTDAEGLLKIDGILPGMEYFIMDASGSRSEAGWPARYYNEKIALIPPAWKEGKISSFEGIDVAFNPEQAKDKMLLVCFFDFEQRPSRNSILQLAKQAEQLQQKGLVVVAIQASKMEEAELRTWAKDNNVTFPLGIARDGDETRSAWGIRALPWLILTDKDHNVQTQGFAIDELDAKMARLADAPK